MVWPTWDPRTEDELRTAAVNGVLEEAHHVELKRQLNSGPAANKELARDLASFAIDGGLVLFGVDEATTPPSLYPIPTSGVPERIEQVALMNADPPLVVRTTIVAADSRPGEGYLVVRVPPSPLAPHMVGSSYFGRGEKTKRTLADEEVVRLHQRRHMWERDILEALDHWVDRDPWRGRPRSHAHLFLVAEPVAGPRDSLRAVLDVPPWQRSLLNFAMNALSSSGVAEAGHDGFAPGLGVATQSDRRSDGWALTSHDFTTGRALTDNAREDHLVELELTENGSLRAFCGRASALLSSRNVDVVFERLIIGITRQLLAIARAVATTSGHWGPWNIGIAVTGLSAKVSWELAEGFGRQLTAYSAEDYRRGTRASLEELASTPGTVLERLAGPLARALDSHEDPRIERLLGP